MEMVDQFIDQKYDYIQMNNNTDLNNITDNKTYSVEKMRYEIYNETAEKPKEFTP